MFLSGIADEAGKPIETQVAAHRELGWTYIELRSIQSGNVTLIDDAAFDEVERSVKDASLQVSCFASALCNWSRKITGPFQQDVDELKQAIPRMKRLGATFIRCMSYPNDGLSDVEWRDEAIRRLAQLAKMAEEGGVILVHENCSGWGGEGPEQTLEMLEKVDSPNLKLVFDTGNPVPHGQDAWDFYKKAREHIVYVHIKDGRHVAEDKTQYCWPGEGEGHVREIVADLVETGYKGGISIEPHVAAVYHEEGSTSKEETMWSTYLEYGRRLQKIVQEAGGQV